MMAAGGNRSKNSKKMMVAGENCSKNSEKMMSAGENCSKNSEKKLVAGKSCLASFAKLGNTSTETCQDKGPFINQVGFKYKRALNAVQNLIAGGI